MEEIKSDLNTKTTVFLTKEDKIDLIDRIDVTKSDLINRIDITKSDLIDRIDIVKSDLTDRINKVRTELIVWIVGVSLLQYILLIVTRKFF
jgi:exo-beta-1,3-glucanase (GH17 family)